MNYVITAKCESGHTQQITVSGELGRGWADEQAALLDGTSGMYLHSPIGTDSVIGKCGICKAQITCDVTDCEPSAEDQGRNMTDLAICDALIKLYAWKGEPGWWDQGDLGQGDHGIAWAAKRGDDGVTNIYLRGSVTPLDWFRDFLAMAYQPFGHAEMGGVHAGFYIGMPEVWAEMKRCLDPPFRVSGHSLGAGRAAILTGLMTLDGATPVRRVCFGEPRPGFAQLGKLIAPVPAASYRNGDTFHHDYVTDVPFEIPPLLSYVHPYPLTMVCAQPGSAGPQNGGVMAWHHLPLYRQALVNAGVK